MLKSLNEEAACSASGVENALGNPWINLLNDESDDGARCVELAGIASCVSHFAQHRFVEKRHRVDVIGRLEVNFVHAINDVPQKVAGEHPVEGLLEHRREDISWISPFGAGQA